jgi:hypothetical protein
LWAFWKSAKRLPLRGFLAKIAPMNTETTSAMVGTFKAAMLLGNDRFTVVVEITEPLPAADLERAIEGLAGNELRLRVKRCSEVVFLEEVAPLPPDEKIASRLDQPLENPNWLPGVRILAIEQV